MSFYEEEDRGRSGSPRQRDFVLNMNEFAHIQSKTDGNIKCCVGPYQTSLSQQEVPVLFNLKTKRFDECNDYDKAKQLFVSAPEGWYVVLKNPTQSGQYPEKGRPNQTPQDIIIGKKINIFGPVSFALFPGQMAKVVQGHRLRSNQYLIARVYDEKAANDNQAVIKDAEGKEIKTRQKYFPGQLLVIKGTEISFYMPPTGIEVLSVDEKDGHGGNNYIRDALTLERLEYCILKNENGNKRYVHGPAVVFPEPQESFVSTKSGNRCFRAIELSKISGIYIKVIAEYEENGVKHPVGEELFLTGADQMIYYPRPEHAIISYDGKYMHHAIAIPAGEGRYIMNRETGEINTVLGPKMYLPDPRTEVVIKRKLTPQQCSLWYPGNIEVIEYNASLDEKSVEKAMKKSAGNSVSAMFSTAGLNTVTATAFSDAANMSVLESNASISRGTSYTKPRTITLDTKFDGVVSIDVWTGYAINVVSKTGKREVVVGPCTRLLDYDESLEVLELSTGRPKTTDNLIKTTYLRVENNKVSDLINIQTKDFVNVQIKVSYCIDFLPEYKDKWFSIENYVKYMCDRERSLLKREAKLHTIEDFYENATDIVRKIALNLPDEKDKDKKTNGKVGRFFAENGMLVHDVEVLSIQVEREVADLMEEHQENMIRKCLELSNAQRKMEVTQQLCEYEKKQAELHNQLSLFKQELRNIEQEQELEYDESIRVKERAAKQAEKQAEADLQKLLDEINEATLKRSKAQTDARVEHEKKLAQIEKDKNDAYAATVATIMGSISPDLTAALNSRTNAEIMNGIGKAVSPYAMANNEGVAKTINTLLRGTSLEDMVKGIGINK